MPLPHWLTRVNLVVSNRLIAPFASVLPWFGVLEHVGRRSRTVRRTPMTLFRPRSGRYVIALTYGPDVEWLRNVEAAGQCRVKARGRWIVLSDPRRFTDARRRAVPRIVRPILAALRVTEFVELRRVPASSGPSV
ncbi:MAG: nitroreductase family deazaflavin-dependent oxidoreductase [Chloroflexota bacterium]